MNPLTANDLRGVWAPTLPPFWPDDSLAEEQLEHALQRMAASGIHGIDDGGTRVESQQLSAEECLRIAELVTRVCSASGTPFQLGVGSKDPELACERIRALAEFEPGAIGVLLPDTESGSHEEILAVLHSYAEAAGSIGLVLDHPPHASMDLAPKACRSIRESIPTVIGARIGLGTEQWYEEWHKEVEGMSIFVPGHHHVTGKARGADGSCSNIAWMSPKGVLEINELCDGQMPKATDIESRVQCFLITNVLPFQIEECYSSEALDKLLAAAGGWMNGNARLRSPQAWIADERVAHVRAAAIREIPWFLEHSESEAAEAV
ncbi:MAG: 4-hydroxy-tetrahydrodipicolinate synthase [Planctomycetota bacterium]|jgi:4-hydroxy-tetrahydrodipicolinate synthase